ncbi:Tn3 family transposase [Streptomyces sp. MH13]|uniref:Tn3 family transposase n=1 Tax=Streptomyces sp. MH13 TaxID=3417651 RepID=UPI003CE849C9
MGATPVEVTSAGVVCTLRSGSWKNATYTALREVGRVIRTVQLLRYLSDAPLRRRVTAATNKVEVAAMWLQERNGGLTPQKATSRAAPIWSSCRGCVMMNRPRTTTGS